MSRRRVLENELSALKDKVAVILDKTQNDDRLIAALRSEVAALKRGDRQPGAAQALAGGQGGRAQGSTSGLASGPQQR